jgi:hypothetical protein
MTYSTEQYLVNQIEYKRPSALLFAENSGTLTTATDKNGNILNYAGTNTPITTYIPIGYDIYANTPPSSDFLILSDHNRAPLDFKQNRLEKRDRMINGRMRSFWTADKLNISTSWQNLPSRAYSGPPLFDQTTGLPNATVDGNTFYQFTVDGGAGGNELLNWYENHKGSFWVYLSYDKYPNFGSDSTSYQHLNQYSQVVEMFISDFTYSVVKRGGGATGTNSGYDMWNISMSLEEA